MTDDTVLEVQAAKLIHEEDVAATEARRAAKVAELRAEAEAEAEAQRLEDAAKAHSAAVAKARKRARRQATVAEDALQAFAGAVRELLNLPHGNDHARQLITWRVETVLNPLLPDVRSHPGQRQHRPLDETLFPGGDA